MQNYLTPNFAFAPMRPDHAEGSRLWDENGKEYIDLAGGIAVNALGHCNPDLIAALNEQAHKYWHVSNYFTTAPAQNLAKRLVDNTFADKVFSPTQARKPTKPHSNSPANSPAIILAKPKPKLLPAPTPFTDAHCLPCPLADSPNTAKTMRRCRKALPTLRSTMWTRFAPPCPTKPAP